MGPWERLGRTLGLLVLVATLTAASAWGTLVRQSPLPASSSLPAGSTAGQSLPAESAETPLQSASPQGTSETAAAFSALLDFLGLNSSEFRALQGAPDGWTGLAAGAAGGLIAAGGPDSAEGEAPDAAADAGLPEEERPHVMMPGSRKRSVPT